MDLIYDFDNLEFEEIYPKIIVYRNMLSNPDKAYETMMQSESTGEGKYYLKNWEDIAHNG